MKYREYTEFCSLLKELDDVSQILLKHNYRGIGIELEYYGSTVICVLKTAIANSKSILSTINRLKHKYANEADDIDVLILEDVYYLVYSKNEKINIKIYNSDETKAITPGSFNTFISLSGEKNNRFIGAEKRKNQNNEESYVCYDCNLYGTDKKICEDVKSWKFIGENIVVFELNNNKGIVVYDKYNNDIIFENVDEISPLEEKIGNYDPEETYLVEKSLHIDDKEILLGFFMNKDGYAVSDVFDSYGNFYRLIDRENNRYLNKRLESIFEDITEMYKNNEVKSNIENILVKKYKNKQ